LQHESVETVTAEQMQTLLAPNVQLRESATKMTNVEETSKEAKAKKVTLTLKNVHPKLERPENPLGLDVKEFDFELLFLKTVTLTDTLKLVMLHSNITSALSIGTPYSGKYDEIVKALK
jgi:hypothetical protein